MPKAIFEKGKNGNLVISNQGAWSLGVRSTFTTLGMGHLFRKSFCQTVPNHEYQQAQMQELVNTHKALIKRRSKPDANGVAKKLELGKDGGTREGEDIDSFPDSDKSASASAALPFASPLVLPRKQKPSDDKAKQRENLLIANATFLMAADDEDDPMALILKGQELPPIYLDPFTLVHEGNRELFPSSVHEIKVEVGDGKDKHWASAESQTQKQLRAVAWQLMKYSIANLPAHKYAHVQEGNLFELMKLINTQYIAKNREDLIKDLQKELETMKKDKSATFVVFKEDFEKKIARLVALGIKEDDAMVRDTLEKAIMRTNDMWLSQVAMTATVSLDKGGKKAPWRDYLEQIAVLMLTV